MNEQNWTRDKTPYVVFSCNKCHQFSYVKLTQKTKKCLRCGRSHRVNSIITTGEKVSGISNALELVKKNQAELKGDPDFEVDTSFKISMDPDPRPNKKEKSVQTEHRKKDLTSVENEEDYSYQFRQMIYELANMYNSFPKYLIELMAEDHSIPMQKVSGLIRMMIRQGFLQYSKKQNHYFVSN